MIDFPFITGGVAGAILLAAFILVPLMRNLLLVAAASGIAAAYAHGGVAALLAYASTLQEQVLSQPTFAAGVVAGMVLVAVGIGTNRSRRVAG